MIIAVSRIKDAADVIEAFIRGNSIVVDKFIIIDNNSCDKTLEILYSLQKEGFNIDIINNFSFFTRQKNQMQTLINYARDQYNPDIVLPLDDDEIIASDKIDNVKEYLLSLPQSKIYKVRWRNYTMLGQEDDNIASPLLRIPYCFIHNEYEFPKVILTREVLSMKGFMITQGNHGLNWAGAGESPSLDVEFLNDLYLAHYPIRSVAQAKSKFLVGWITDYLSTPLKQELGKNSYWLKLYEKIKNNEFYGSDIVQYMGLYRQKIGSGFDEIDLIMNKRINLPPQCFENKYGYIVDPFYNFICNTEELAKAYANVLEQQGVEKFNFDFSKERNVL